MIFRKKILTGILADQIDEFLRENPEYIAANPNKQENAPVSIPEIAPIPEIKKPSIVRRMEKKEILTAADYYEGYGWF